jgi:ATP-dependent RNA helicase DDX24/MAK5
MPLIMSHREVKTMIFCNTVASLHELEYFFEDKGINCLTLHSQLPKKARLQNYSLFRDSENGILISTDLGARGLDFPHLHRVINYDFPNSLCDYLQRVGRTGRAVNININVGQKRTSHFVI